VFSEFLADHKVMIRTDSWKYIYSTGDRDLGQGYATGLGAPGVTHRLYDLISDPQEHTNVAERPEHLEVVTELQQELLNHFRQTHPKADQVPANVSTEEQLALFCIPPEGEDEGAK
jgi:choline-sulfatase